MCYRDLLITKRITGFPARLVSWSSENVPAKAEMLFGFQL